MKKIIILFLITSGFTLTTTFLFNKINFADDIERINWITNASLSILLGVIAIFITLLGLFVGLKENAEKSILIRNINNWVGEIIAFIFWSILWLFLLITSIYINDYKEPISISIVITSCLYLIYMVISVIKK